MFDQDCAYDRFANAMQRMDEVYSPAVEHEEAEDGLPAQGQQHAAFGLSLEDLDIVVIDESRAMQSLIRSMIQPLKPRRLRIHNTAAEALRDMLVEPPSLVLTELKMDTMSGYRLIKVMRHMSMNPLCFVPILALTAYATRSSVENVLRAGAHCVMVKPVSATALKQRIEWLLSDARTFSLNHDSYVIEGVSDILDARRKKDRLPAIIQQLHVEHDQAVSQARKAQSVVDKILNGSVNEADVPEAGLVATPPASKKATPAPRLAAPRPLRVAAKPLANKPAKQDNAKENSAMPKKNNGSGWRDLWG